MPTLEDRRATLLARLGELDARLHAIEAELDLPHSRDWEEDAVEREGDEVLEALGEAGQEEILRELRRRVEFMTREGERHGR